jgi:hypothetical protein
MERQQRIPQLTTVWNSTGRSAPPIDGGFRPQPALRDGVLQKSAVTMQLIAVLCPRSEPSTSGAGIFSSSAAAIAL